ncbi:hypothetical protein MKX01_008187 [Papaver californicum]|nr:hypothetical protein MKX01_008187 [Papaver californicum]
MPMKMMLFSCLSFWSLWFWRLDTLHYEKARRGDSMSEIYLDSRGRLKAHAYLQTGHQRGTEFAVMGRTLNFPGD